MCPEVSDKQVEIIQEFVQESQDMIDQLEPTIIELGQSGGDKDTVNAVFRLFHSMKGSAGFLELNYITKVAHAAENLLDMVRSDQLTLNNDHVSLLVASCDFSKEALEIVDQEFDDSSMAAKAEDLTQKLKQAMETTEAGEQEEAPAQPQAQSPEEPSTESDAADSSAPEPTPGEPPEEFSLEINEDMLNRFIQEAEELLENAEQGLLEWSQDPDNFVAIGTIFRHIHSFKGNCGFFGYEQLERLSHQMETLLDIAKQGGQLKTNNLADTLLPKLDILKNVVGHLQENQGQVPDLESHLNEMKQLITPRLGELLIEQGIVDRATVEDALKEQQKPLGERLVESGKASPEDIDKTLQAQEEKKRASEAAPAQAAEDKKADSGSQQTAAKSSGQQRQDIRVDLEKLDSLIDLIGEMVIAENMLVHNPELEGLELENFNKAAQQMSKLVRELQEMAMVIRMVPISGLFRRMLRLVHDLSGKFGKKVDFQISGQDTEVDKTIIETITDPLVHLLRNSMDHGLETPEERLAVGKPETGTLTLSACHEEGEVWITIEDDGKGLNRDKILQKARDNGLIEGDGSDLSDKYVHNLIFQPGFSTADQISDVSGRGVGMDVVKQNLEKIRGKVEAISVFGKGTQFRLRIPLTLAIIDGMLVRVGDSKAIVPILAIKEAFKNEEEQVTHTPEGKELVRVREQFLPVVRLHDMLEREPDSRNLTDGTLIVLEYQGHSICLFVDEILGQQQTVIKGLSKYIGNVPGCSGCTILGNGEVCLILDIGTIVEQSHGRRERNAS